jgi:hypothetical protein
MRLRPVYVAVGLMGVREAGDGEGCQHAVTLRKKKKPRHTSQRVGAALHAAHRTPKRARTWSKFAE